jgi:HK97 family phage portal protein
MMSKWQLATFHNKRIRQPQNKYIPKATPTVIENALPIGRGATVRVDAGGDLVFATCIEILAKRLAMTKWSVYGDDFNQVQYLAQAFNTTLNLQPYYGINAFDFWEYMEKQRLSNGNAFAYICGSGADAKLVPLDAAYVTMYWDDANILDGNRKIWYQYAVPDSSGPGARVVTIAPENMLHFKAFAANGLLGRRAVDVLRDTLKSNAEVEGAMRSTIENGFAGTILLTYTSDLSQSRRAELIKQVKELMGGADHTIVPLPAGVNASNFNNDVRAYHETLKSANAESISAFFGIPLAMLNKGGGSGMATFSTNQMTQFFNATIDPIIRQYANELTIKLLTAKQINRGYKFDDSSDGFDYLDAQAKASVINTYVGAGIISKNEARISLMYPASNDPYADQLNERGAGGRLGDSAGNEGAGDNGSGQNG